MKPLIVANWKMNPSSERAALALFGRLRRLLKGIRGVEVAVAPPFPYLALARGYLPFRLAGQDLFWEMAGPYTGEVSSAMLADLGARYVIVGHSERRRLGEDDHAVNLKVRAVLRAGMTPIIAIGEESRESQEVVPATLSIELSSAIRDIPKRELRGIVVAYEPVWAVSTTRGASPDTPDHATRRAIYIRKLLTKMLGSRIADSIRILYGGSVNAKNAADYISSDIRGMEGLLVGGASLRAEEFAAIVRSAARR
ncbi:MAG: triose-phosphate isomerase [Candidatus Sungbacteria bacterium]|uniref:Triosephosphate isomerase n=1 Tax=Candidatus Sungiibacteriota bacterium TaxID=2750080 RepID=A0A932YXC9_9BACT|nr:triose-phosphate isomerase [Candidatus Sungbacteria bacterium]